jgi:glycerophosphoryl diester phosphodiesterase
MLDTNHSLSPLQYTVEEQLLVSKTGHDEDCEDAIYTGPHFVAVIDGATSRTKRRWDGKTSGRIAAETIRATFDQLPYNATAFQTTDILTTAISSLYEQYGVFDIAQSDPVQRAVASFVAVSLWRKEIWFIGDCQCLLGNEQISNITNVKEVDSIVANARSLFLEAEIARGKTVADLLQYDTGREFILPLMKQQMLFQNKPSTGQYWYAVIDGFEVPDEGICIQSLPADTKTIVLASDGYPYLRGSLDESEQALHALLRDDPLLFRQYKATKGMTAGLVSFDDRAYVKVTIPHG